VSGSYILRGQMCKAYKAKREKTLVYYFRI
jgi:hypothetical protein